MPMMSPRGTPRGERRARVPRSCSPLPPLLRLTGMPSFRTRNPPRRQTRIGTAPLLMPLADICAPGAVIIGSARARDDQTRPGGRALKEHLLATTPPPLLVMDRPYGRKLDESDGTLPV